ncbi:MAG: cytochrome c [Dehalococcoidia bacterium]|nr:cytochrome c [Dehalococcoidia bacterium]
MPIREDALTDEGTVGHGSHGLARAIFIGLVTLLGAWVGWSACAGAGPELALTAEEGRGRVLYTQYCAQCHGGATGGKLKDIPPRHNANGHTWHHPDQQLIEIVLNGFSFSVESQKMPAFKATLTEEDVRVVLAYIKTWWTSEQREWQAKVIAQAGQ